MLRALGASLPLWGSGLVASLLGGQTLYVFFGATHQECEAVQSACNLMDRDHGRGMVALEDVIAGNPQNRLAKLLLGKLLLKEGRAEHALAKIRPLISGDRPFPLALSLATDIAKATGDRQLASDSYQALLTASPDYLVGHVPMERLDKSLLAAKAEADGEFAKAKQLFECALDEDSTECSYITSLQLGEFHLRQGEYNSALNVFRLAHERAKRVSAKRWCALLLQKQATALWALGRNREALATSIQSAVSLLSGDRCEDRELLADAIVQAYTLADGTAVADADRRKARDLLQQSEKYMRATQPYSSESLVLVLCGRQSSAEEVKKVSAVLKGAPNLDWAVWSALYLGLTDPDKAGHLLELLPPDSVQATIRSRTSG